MPTSVKHVRFEFASEIERKCLLPSVCSFRACNWLTAEQICPTLPVAWNWSRSQTHAHTHTMRSFEFFKKKKKKPTQNMAADPYTLTCCVCCIWKEIRVTKVTTVSLFERITTTTTTTNACNQIFCIFEHFPTDIFSWLTLTIRGICIQVQKRCNNRWLCMDLILH